MFTLTLTPNRSTPKRYATTLTYERKDGRVTPVRRVYEYGPKGQKRCVSVRTEAWPRKDWAPCYSGEKGTHKRPFTIKRDWLQLHEGLHWDRVSAAEVA